MKPKNPNYMPDWMQNQMRTAFKNKDKFQIILLNEAYYDFRKKLNNWRSLYV